MKNGVDDGFWKIYDRNGNLVFRKYIPFFLSCTFIYEHFILDNRLNNIYVTFILKEYDIQEVIHFAAQSHVQNSFDDSLQYTQDNIVGTHTLLESCRIYGKITKFIHVSTDEVYGESMLSLEEQMKY